LQAAQHHPDLALIHCDNAGVSFDGWFDAFQDS
jgi:hypothetical protein